MPVVRYELPSNWIAYDQVEVCAALAEAKAAVSSLVSTPFQRGWVEKLQQIQLKMEIAGTSRIEGADFTEHELDAALQPDLPTHLLVTRSQRQANAAVRAYRWISTLESDRPINDGLIRQVHSMIVAGCDDDHCEPGKLRGPDCNVTFGLPRHRGCEGGPECDRAFSALLSAVTKDFPRHDLLVQAIALHYHLAAMHPFLDGNGRTARALEALVLQRAGLRDSAFIAMSNYYYDEKTRYLEVLSEVRAHEHALTPFLVFALRGVTVQCGRLFAEIRRNMQKALFRNTMYDLFNRLVSKRTRVIKERQIEILKILLTSETVELDELHKATADSYRSLKDGERAFVRDIISLRSLGALTAAKVDGERINISIELDWPTKITESTFFAAIRKMPRGKTYKIL
jgi:Fic family protein